MTNIAERIIVDPDQCRGHPCIRDMHIRVVDILNLLADGLGSSEVMERFPGLKPEDIQAIMKYAAHQIPTPAQTETLYHWWVVEKFLMQNGFDEVSVEESKGAYH